MVFTLTPIADLKGDQGNPGDLGAVVALGNVTGNVDLSASVTTLASQIVSMTLTGNTTITALPAPPAGLGGTATLVIRQDATGGRTLTINNAATAYAVAPSLSTAANAVDIWHLMWTGATWVCIVGSTAVAVPTSWIV